MPYASELLNNKVFESSDKAVGRLEDILILSAPGSFAPLEYLVIKTSADKQTRFVPYENVANFTSSQISLKSLFNKVALSELPARNYSYLKKDVLDRQIVDVEGTRVVRVNDLRIGNFENKTCVLGIDASFSGLLRRIGLGESVLAKLFSVHLIDWREAQFVGSGPLQLKTAAGDLSQLHPADLANIVEDLDVKQGSSLLASLDEKKAAKVLEEVDPRLQNILVKYLGPEKAGKILAEMSSDEIVDLVKSFSGKEAREFLAKVNGGKSKSIEKLISYPDNTAGGLMTLDFFSARPEWNVRQTMEELHKISSSLRSLIYIYVTGEDGHFYGVVSLRRLMLAGSDSTIKRITKTVSARSALKANDSMRRIIGLMTRYNLYNAAVLDKDRKLLGVVTIDDVMRQLFPNA